MTDDRSPAQKRRDARNASLISWAHTRDRRARTAPALAAAEEKYADIVDPERVMSETDRAKAIKAYKSVKFSQLAQKRWAA